MNCLSHFITGAIAASTGETTEPREQRIAGDVAQVLAPPRPEAQQRDHPQHQVGTAVVVPEPVPTEASAETLGQTEDPEVAAPTTHRAPGSSKIGSRA